MANLLQYLNHYQARDEREKVIIEVLSQGLELKGTDRSMLTARQLRNLEFQWKKWRSQLIGQVFYSLPALSRPRQMVAAQYQADYDSLLNEIAAEFALKILSEFDPNLVLQGKTLTAKLTIWVNSKLRLKWRLLDLVTPQKKTKEVRLLEIILELVRRSPDGFTKTDFLADVAKQKNIDAKFATEYLLELLPRFWSAAPEDERYFLDCSRLQAYLDQLCAQAYVKTLDPAIAAQIPDTTQSISTDQAPTLSQKIAQLLVTYRQDLKQICLKNNPHCNCVLLLENYFQEQLYDVSVNEEKIVYLLGVKRATYQSHLERKCLPAFWEFAIQTSPVSQFNHKIHKILLKEYVEADPKLLLQKCYYSDKNKRDYPDCNCQSLAKQMLIFFTPKPEKWKNLALFYDLTVDTLARFWKMKCLFLLSLVVFELEQEYTDSLKLD
ncbi:MAG: hypothetical protein WBB82_09150 [Limnothrix sp.]